MNPKYVITDAQKEDLVRRFTYHKPTGTQSERYDAITEATRNLALLLSGLCPQSRELSTAITLLAQARMMANSSIAIHENNDSK